MGKHVIAEMTVRRLRTMQIDTGRGQVFEMENPFAPI